MNRGSLGALALSLVLGCAADQKDAKTANDAKGGGGENTPAPVSADRSRCDKTGKRVVELDVNKDKRPDVWKVYAPTVEGGAKVDVLSCKEVNLNFDNHLDMWVYYDNQGNVTLEEFDQDFDGKINHWFYYQQGKRVRQELDTSFDGKADIWMFYELGKLVRIERSSKGNGKVDVWEYYENDRLDRIGWDTTGSGRADKWERAPEPPPAEGAGGAGGAQPPAGGVAPASSTTQQPGAQPAAAGSTPAPAPDAKAKE